MRVSIRAALLQDVPALAGIERAAATRFASLPELAWIADSAPTDRTEVKRLVAGGAAWVAVAAARPVGFLLAEPAGGELHIVELSVAARHQGAGIGGRLIEAAGAYGRAQGLQALTLTTFRDVPWNGPFYARRGFVELTRPALGGRLAAILDRERRHSLPAHRRCAMRWPLR